MAIFQGRFHYQVKNTLPKNYKVVSLRSLVFKEVFKGI